MKTPSRAVNELVTGALPDTVRGGGRAKLAGWGFLAVLLLATPAHADTLYWLGAKLPNSATYPDGGGDPMKYFVDETQSSPGGLPVQNVEQEIRDAYQQWQDVQCAYIGFAFQGAISDPAQLGNHADSKNVMGAFVDTRTDSRYHDDLGGGVAIGVALTYTQAGVILGCDTEYNHADFQFSDTTPAPNLDFPSLALHEQGHCVGLDHDPHDFTSVLYPTANAGDLRRTLDAHDVDNVCQLYPETGSLGSPCAGNSCGSGLSCIANTTQGGNFCSRGCDVADTASCPAGFGCRASAAIGGQTAACYPGAGDNTSNVGGPCTQNSNCNGASGQCFDELNNNFPSGYCTQLCSPNVATSCPSGSVCLNAFSNFYCLATCKFTVTQGLGIGDSCRPGYACVPTDVSTGHGVCAPACTDDASCGGQLRCLCDGVCYSSGSGQSFIGHACVSAGDCPTGDSCVPPTSNGQATGWPGGYCISPCGSGAESCRGCAIGSACVAVGAEGETFCMQSCDANGGCRTGYTCVVRPTSDHQTTSVCAPSCTSDTDCPVGEQCQGGACIDPFAPDAGGCGPLCGDGGAQVTTTGGGTTGETVPPPAAPGGCGCGSGSGSASLLFLAVGLLALSRRRAW